MQKQENKEFIYKEIHGDLFQHHGNSKTVSLAHCISSDARMGQGIAVLFREKFGCAEEIRSRNVENGDIIILNKSPHVSNGNISTPTRYIYYLVTKQKYFEKPTYETLRSSLLCMKKHAIENKVQCIAMPRIGCGLDGLEWETVSKMIREIFMHEKIHVLIYYL